MGAGGEPEVQIAQLVRHIGDLFRQSGGRLQPAALEMEVDQMSARMRVAVADNCGVDRRRSVRLRRTVQLGLAARLKEVQDGLGTAPPACDQLRGRSEE